MKSDDRREAIMTAALTVAAKVGYIATEADCSPGLVSAYLGTMPAMRRAVMRAAVARRVLAVVAQGLAMRDKHAMAAPEGVRAAAVRGLR
jgi:hypothetical protein